MRRPALALGIGLLGACGSPAPESRETTGPRRVIVVGMDTVRSDHMGFMGHPGGLTPSLDAVAAESVVFEQAWTPAPRTRPSFRSATTGRWPIAGRTAPTLGALLGAQGFETAGFVANVQLSEQLGFAEGFDTWVLDNMATADAQVDAALGWIRERVQADVLLSLHLMDPHIFYTPPPPFTDRFTVAADRQGMPDRYNRMNVIKQDQRGLLSDAQKRWIQGRYQGEIAYMDQELGRLVEAIDALPGETWLIFHSDHGEEFWDHGGFEHNHTLHDELISAVFMVRPPKNSGVDSQRVSRPVSLVDIPPTVLSVMGVSEGAWPTFDGYDLSPLWSEGGDAVLEKRLSSRPLQIGHMMYSREQWGVIRGEDKYIVTTGTGDISWTRSGHVQEGVDLGLEGALSEATGWPVLRGWRLSFQDLPGPIRLRFKEQVGRATVIDPEALRLRRANLAWGERPPRAPSDVASLQLSEDGRLLEISPGASPTGVVFVAMDVDTNTVRSGCAGDGDEILVAGPQQVCDVRLTLKAGPYVDQPPTGIVEAAAHDEANIETLKMLGYLD